MNKYSTSAILLLLIIIVLSLPSTKISLSIGNPKEETSKYAIEHYTTIRYSIYNAEVITELYDSGGVKTFRIIGDGFDISDIAAYNYNKYSNNYYIIEYYRYGKKYNTIVVPMDI